MERAIDSLKYEGSILDACLEAKAQKKLLAVYISCEDENWLKWEQSTFAHPLVVDFISKYCVFLHLIWGSLGSSQFSAIYPQKAVPSISVVGYTGVLLWHESRFMDDGEGYVDARDIVNSFHKALATLRLQGLECLDSSISDGQTNTSENLSEQSEDGQLAIPNNSVDQSACEMDDDGLECLDSSISDGQTNTSEKLSEHSEDGQLAIPNNSVDQSACEMNDDEDTKQGKEKCTKWDVKEDRVEQSNSTTETSKEVLSSVGRNVNHPVICNDGVVSLEPQEIIPSDKSHKKTSETAEVVMASCSPESSQITTNQVEGRIEDKKDDDHPVMFNEGDVSLEPQGNIPSGESHNKTSETAVVVMSSCSPGSSQITTYQVEERSEAKKGDDLADYSNATISKDIHLHIRMPTGAMLQASFDMADTLRSVKNYIDENQSGTGSYDLAVTYPRKVFSEQDMTSPMSELGLARRQSLLVVPRKATERLRGLPLNRSQYPVSGTDSGNINGGYFRHVKWVLSYMNPFSYFGSEAAPNEPNPTIQNQLPGPETSSRTIPLDRQNSTAGDNANNPRVRASNSRPFGSNIHTLRESEDEDPSADRNMFWNGNSTQYGGDDKK